MKKLVNQVINEIFRQLTLTLELDVPVRPMDAKGLSSADKLKEFVHSYLADFSHIQVV